MYTKTIARNGNDSNIFPLENRAQNNCYTFFISTNFEEHQLNFVEYNTYYNKLIKTFFLP